MNTKVTKCSPPYPDGYKPNYIFPAQYCPYRFGLGKLGSDPLVAICMNPSAAVCAVCCAVFIFPADKAFAAGCCRRILYVYCIAQAICITVRNITGAFA